MAFSGDGVGEIPESLGNMVNARKIFVNNNCIQGSIPASLGNLTNLRVRMATLHTLYNTFLYLSLLFCIIKDYSSSLHLREEGQAGVSTLLHALTGSRWRNVRSKTVPTC